MKKEVVRDEFIRKRMERQRKLRKRRLIAFFIVFIILLLCVGAVLSFTVFFSIDDISVKGSKIYSSEEILSKSNIVKGDNLFAVNRAKTENLLKKKLPYIEKVEFERNLPGSLKITVKDADEFAVYKIDDIFYVVSSENWVLEKRIEQPKDLLIINALDVKCKVGSQIEFKDETQQAIITDLTGILKEKNVNVKEIDTNNILEIKLNVDDRFEVNLGTTNNLIEKIKHLDGMLAKIPEEKSGKINLSMWSSTNKNGTFTAENK